MVEVFKGSEALAGGGLTRARLRWNYRALFPDVYAPKEAANSLRSNTIGAWLWSRRDGVISGRAAAALHGAKWVDDDTPVEMIWRCGRPPPGIIVRNELIEDHEIVEIAGLTVTSLQRTAWDIARHMPRDIAVRHLDALANATDVKASDVLLLGERYQRARGLPRARKALALVDGGAQSPRETWLRLLLIDAGNPPPRTQIRVTDGFNEAFIDMGYDEPKVGLDYDGQYHFTDRGRYVHDIGRAELIDGQGWIDIHVVAEHTRGYILHRVGEAFSRRGYRPNLR
ncbi:hypothetical protein [Mycolicibacterium stellerae]|uniref:hypothetical protein n=1 Tax=Mycolicibacterium stellerae TaxID=2358193 RepID=UPI000F0B7F0A|nr:hypothetical protein [Mycolicibacterium stellerae]